MIFLPFPTPYGLPSEPFQVRLAATISPNGVINDLAPYSPAARS